MALICSVVSPTALAGSAPGHEWPPPSTLYSTTDDPGVHSVHCRRTTWDPIRVRRGWARQRSSRAQSPMLSSVPRTFTPGSDSPTAPLR